MDHNYDLLNHPGIPTDFPENNNSSSTIDLTLARNLCHLHHIWAADTNLEDGTDHATISTSFVLPIPNTPTKNLHKTN
jgi:hypothetical protein